MRSLTAHLTEPGSHGRLPFHPDCPVCRSARLAGPLPADPLVSQRTQASVVAAVLALSAAGPAAAIASADTPGGEGTASPVGAGGPGQQGPSFDPGSEVPLPNEIPAPAGPVAGGDDDTPGGPVEGEPQEQLSAPATTPTTQTPNSPSAPRPATQPATTPPAPGPAATTQPPPTADQGTAEPRPTHKRHDDPPQRSPRSERPPPAPMAAPAAPRGSVAATTPTPTPDGAAGGGTAGGATQAAAAGGIPAGAGAYVVRSGDSLWSIARRVLAPGASTAQVAREVHRLWQLNADRIGTGDPDLIMAGQALRLR